MVFLVRLIMKTTAKSDTVSMLGGILLEPVTAAMIERGFGILKRKPGEKPLIEEWIEHKSKERVREDAIEL